MTIQVNLVPNPSETWRRQHKFARSVAIKIFAINIQCTITDISWLPPWILHLFHNGLLGGPTLFYSWAVFGLDYLNTEISPIYLPTVCSHAVYVEYIPVVKRSECAWKVKNKNLPPSVIPSCLVLLAEF